MRLTVLSCVVMAFLGCAYNANCVDSNVIKAVVYVGQNDMEFNIVLSEGAKVAYVRYGTEINEMGTTSEVSAIGQITIQKLKPNTVYYWQIVQEGRCGTIEGRIYEDRTLF